MHAPQPMTPMSGWWASRFAVGFSAGLASHSVPMRVLTARFNTYFYMSVGPSVPPERMPEMEVVAEARLREAFGVFWQRWHDEWLPELKRGWEERSRVDVARLSDADLRAFVARAVDWYERVWTIHFEMLIPAMVGVSVFQDLYTSLLPGREPLTAYRLLQGFDNMSFEAGRKLWELAMKARGNSELHDLVAVTPSGDLWERLGGSPAGLAFRDELAAYLAFYGRRSDTVQELGDPSWVEDPKPALDALKGYLDEGKDPAVTLALHATEREQAVAETRATIAGLPAEAREGFEAMLTVAQRFARVQEDHNFWIDQRSLHEVRQLCLEVGRRLADRGHLETRYDVMLLDMDEALARLSGADIDTRALADSRREEMERWRSVAPPPMVGTDYGPPPDNPVVRAIGRFWGAPPSTAATARELHGNPGSAGKVVGVARVVMSIDHADRLEPGDILVTATTSPPWTPLFGIASGIVTDAGGVLSHCAIMAREYGIPAVVGAVGATSLIRDGARIEVNGDQGLVRILG